MAFCRSRPILPVQQIQISYGHPMAKKCSSRYLAPSQGGTAPLVPDLVSFTVKDSERQVQLNGTVAITSNGTYSILVPLLAARSGNTESGRQYILTVSAV